MDNVGITRLVEQRRRHRLARDWALADALRLQLLQRGVVCIDGGGVGGGGEGEGEGAAWLRVGGGGGSINGGSDGSALHSACMVWSHRKLQFCPRARAAGEWFCRECADKGKLQGRVPCPLDPRHHVRPAKVRAHLAVCQSRPGETALKSHDADEETRMKATHGYAPGINRRHRPPESSNANSGADGRTTAAAAEDAAQKCKRIDVLRDLEGKVDAALRALGVLAADTGAVTALPAEFASDIRHHHLSSERGDGVSAPNIGVKRGREMPQHASIVQHLLAASGLDTAIRAPSSSASSSADAASDASDAAHAASTSGQRNVAAVECCAGRGRLSMALQKHCYGNNTPLAPPATSNTVRTNFVLVDRATRRRRADANLGIHPCCSAERITLDMADLSLAGLPAVQQAHDVLVFGKHLCGAAADLSLMACQTLVQEASSSSSSSSSAAAVAAAAAAPGALLAPPPTTVTFALCCHHLCEWDALLGRDVLTAVGLDATDFSVLRRLCTFYRKQPKPSASSSTSASAIAATARARLGVKIKRLLNECRAKFLRDSGVWKGGVRIVQYVHEDTTPENQLLVASTVLRTSHPAGDAQSTTTPLSPERQRQRQRRRTASPSNHITAVLSSSSSSTVLQTCLCLLVFCCLSMLPASVPTVGAVNLHDQAFRFQEDTTVPPIPPAEAPDRPVPREETGVDGLGVAIAVGMQVVRGPDWRYGRQDGYSKQSPPSQKKLAESRETWEAMPRGTVVEVRRWMTSFENGTRSENGSTTSGTPVTVPGSVRVQWDHKPMAGKEKKDGLDGRRRRLTAAQQRAQAGLQPAQNQGGFVNVYRYGAEGKYDVRVVDQGISPVDWESVIRQMPDRNYILPGANGGTQRVDKHGLPVKTKKGQYGGRGGSPGRGSYHSQVFTHQADRDALVAIYRAGGGRKWTSSRGWRQGCDVQHNDTVALETDPCRDNWPGVTCDHTTARYTPGAPARVFALDLSSNRMTGYLAPEVGNMTSLRTLTMANNALGGTLPPTLARCVDLEFLSLEVNRLEGTVPRDYGGMHRLQWLSLYNNRLAGEFPVEVARLQALTHVFLQQNRFSGPKPVMVSRVMEKFEYHGNRWDRVKAARSMNGERSEM